jgi:hypothetical protein
VAVAIQRDFTKTDTRNRATWSSVEFRDVVRESEFWDVVRRSGKLRCGWAQNRLDIAYDDYPYKTSRSLHNLTTGASVTVSGLIDVIEFGYSLSQSVGLFLVTPACNRINLRSAQ